MANKLSLDDVLSGNFAKARLDDTKPSNTNKLSLEDVLAGNFNKKTTLPTTDPDIITPSRRSDNTRNKPKVINPEIKEGLGYMGKRGWTGLTQDAPAAAIQALGLSVGKAISEFNTESPITAFDKIKKADSFGDKLSAGLEGIVNYSPYTNGPAAAVPKTLTNAAKGVVDVFTNKEDAEKIAEKIFNYAEPFVERSEEVQREGEKYPDWVQTGAKAAGAVGMMLPSIALSALTRSPNVGLTAMSMMAGGSAGKEAYDKTGDLDVAWKYGAAAGVTEFATERMFRLMDPFLGASGADKAIKKMLSGLNDYKVVKTLLTGALGATGEGIEEVIVELVDPYLRRATFDPNAPQAKKEDLVEVFTVGALAGLIMKGTMGPIQAIGDNKQRRQYVQQKADAANELASMLPTEHRPEILEITSRTTIEEVDEYYGKIIDAANTAEQEIGKRDYSEYPLEDSELEGNPRLAEVREKYKDEVEKLESLYGTINLTPEQREEATAVHSIDVATLEKEAQDAARDFYLPPKMRLEKAIVEGIAHKYYSPEVIRRYIDQKKEADKAIKPKVLVGGKQVDKTKFMSQLKEKDPTLEDNELEEMFIKAQLESSRNLKVEEFVMQTNEAFSQYGVKVDVSYYLPKQERGFYDPKTKTITLNAKTIKSRSVASYVLSHEITHYAIAKDPELLSQLKQSAKLLDYDIAQHNEGIRNAYEKRTGQTLSEEYLTEESIADFVSTVLQDDNLLMQLANKKPTTLQRVAQVITDALMYTRQDRAIRKYKKDVAKKLSAALEGRLVVDSNVVDRYSLDTEYDAQYNTKEEIKALISKYYHKDEGGALDVATEAISDLQVFEERAISAEYSSRVDRFKRSTGLGGGRTEFTGAGRVIARRFTSELIDKGQINFTGLEINSAHELATLAQVYRDPRFETRRIFFMRGKTVVGQEALSSRLPSVAKIFREENRGEFAKKLQEKMGRLKADSFYFMHNHPSGNPKPSEDDKRVTEVLNYLFPEFKGHIIINSNKYAVSNRAGSIWATHRLDLGEDILLKPATPNPIFGQKLNDAEKVAAALKTVQVNTADCAIGIFLGTKLDVQTVMELNISFMLKNKEEYKNFIKNRLVEYGARSVVISYPKFEPGFLQGNDYAELGVLDAEMVNREYYLDVLYDGEVESYREKYPLLGLPDWQTLISDGGRPYWERTPIPAPRYSLENENVGYRAGKFGKSERYFNMMSGNRGTGHFGTGTYFVGDPSKIELEDYNKRTQHMVDFNGYNLFKPRTSQQAFDLHGFLKFVNYDNQKLGALNYSTDQIVEEKNKVYNATESILDFLSLYDFDKEKVFKASDEYFDFTDAELIKENEEYARNKEIIKAAIANRALISWRAISNIQNEVDKGVGYKTPEWMVYNYYSGLQEYFEENFIRDILETQREVTERLNIGARVLGLTVEDLQSELQYINERYAIAPSWFDEEAMAQDTPATIFMKRLGYEGVDVRGLKEVDNTTYGSVIYDLNPSSIRYSLSPDFYNKSTKLIETKLPKNLNGTQTLEWLRNGQNIREEELKWTGLAVYLTEKGSEKVSKEELLEFIAANELPIDEITLRWITTDKLPEDLNELRSNAIAQANKLESMIKQTVEPILKKYVTFKLSNDEIEGTNITELIKHVTRKLIEGGRDLNVPLLSFEEEIKEEIKKELPSEYEKELDSYKKLTGDYKIKSEQFEKMQAAARTQYSQYTLYGDEWQWPEDLKDHYDNYKELLFHWNNGKYLYGAPHFGDHNTNLLMHARIADIEDSDGKKTLFIEELQSDWHQAGREEGYYDRIEREIDYDRLKKLEDEVRELRERKDVLDRQMYSYSEELQQLSIYERYAAKNKARKPSDTELAKIKEEIASLHTRIFYLTNEIHLESQEYEDTEEDIENPNAVRNAPFKDTWHEFLLKRLIRKAAEEDYSRIAWTTGEQQIDRYPGIAKVINRVNYSPAPDTVAHWYVRYWMEGEGVDPNRIRSYDLYSEDDLIRVLGKKIAQDIIDKKGKKTSYTSSSRSGLYEIKYPEPIYVGGEGMINFYNIGGKSSQNIARFLDKYGKQWGAKVEMTEINGIMQPSMEITPEMRESVLKYGQELRYALEMNDDAYLKAVNSGDMRSAQKLVDAMARKAGYTVKAYHGTNAENLNVFKNPLKEIDGNNLIKGYFSEQYEYAAQFNKNEEPGAYYLEIKNPLSLDAVLSVDEMTEQLKKKGITGVKYNESILDEDAINDMLETADRIDPWEFFIYDGGNLTQRIAAAGYDGIVWEEGSDFYEEMATSYMPFEEAAIKSADPVTYDENGEVIPLSQRFDKGNTDIRYSLDSAQDNTGSKITHQQHNYFKGTKVVDAQGKLKKVYHGTMSDFWEFSREHSNPESDMGAGYYFTDNEEDVWSNYATPNGADLNGKIERLADEYIINEDLSEEEAVERARRELMTREEPRTIEAYLKIEKPLILDWRNSTLFDFNMNYDEETGENGEFEGTFVDFIESVVNVLEFHEATENYIEDMQELYFKFADDETIFAYAAINAVKEVLAFYEDPETGYLAANEIIRQAIEDMGFDGIIDKMVSWKWGKDSGRRYVMKGVSSDTTHYIIFDSSQAKEVDNLEPTNSQDLRHSIDDYEDFIKKWKDAQEKYGVKSPGMAPRIETEGNEVPRQFSDDTKASNLLRTTMESPNTPEDFRDPLKLRALSGTGSYLPVSDANALDIANNIITRRGISGATDKWRGIITGQKALNKSDIALGELLLIEAADRGDLEEWEKIVGELCAEATRAGQVVQAFSMLKKLSPQGRIYNIKALVTKLQDELDVRTKGKAPALKIRQELLDQILQARTIAEMEAIEHEIIKEIAQQIPPRISDRVVAWRYLSMLGNFRTHIRNIVSNMFMMVERTLKDVVAATAEGVAGSINPNMQRTKTSAFASQEVRDFVRQDWQVMKPAMLGGGKLGFDDIFARYKKNFGKSVGGRMLNFLDKLNMEGLNVEDSIFMGVAYRKALASYLTANKFSAQFINSGTKEANEALARARKYAVEEGLKATYREANSLATALNNIEQKNVATKIIVGGLMPFKKTPLNIIKRGVEYSPAGWLEAISIETIRLARGKITAAQYFDRLSSGLVGSAAFGLGMYLAFLGLAKAGGSDDKEEYYEQMLGNQPYSITVGGRNYTIDWLTPASMPLMAGVELVTTIMKDGKIDVDEIDFNRLFEALITTADPLTELSMLQGINQALSGYGENRLGETVASAAQSYAGQFIPTLFGQAARTVDPVRRTTYAAKDTDFPFGKKGEQFVNKLINKADVLNRVEKEPYLDMWGREDIRPDNLALRALEQFVTPYYAKDVQKTAVDDELARVFQVNKATGVLPSTPRGNITIDGTTFQLSPKEYTEYKRKVGTQSHAILDDVFKTPEYRNLDQESKEAVIKKVYSYVKEDAKADYAEKKNIEYEAESVLEKVDTAKDAGIDMGTYFVTADQIQRIESDKNPVTGDGVRKDAYGLETRKTKVINYLKGLDITPEEKYAIYLMYYSE